VVLFDDGGELLPDGRAIAPATTYTATDLPQRAAELAVTQPGTAATAPGRCDALVATGIVLAGARR
jgi:hypothetical protein